MRVAVPALNNPPPSARCVPVGDGQTGNRGGHPGGDVENLDGGAAGDGDASFRSVDLLLSVCFCEVQRAEFGGKGDRLCRGKDDRVKLDRASADICIGVGLVDEIAQRTGRSVVEG